MDNKTLFYQDLLGQSKALIANETDVIANMANVSALLFQQLSDISWVGFYRLVDAELVLGPFQGKVACIRIPLGKGVCGVCAATGKIQRIANVHEFDGHIACDAMSNSELVIPIKKAGKVIAVLDIDSRAFARFERQDEQGISAIVNAFEKTLVI
ncbi:MAG: GAF domain-containing protein [Colwellia sp.]